MDTGAGGSAGGDDRRTLGEVGERLAGRYFVERGARILARNWRCVEGELDLVVREPGGTVVAVEVKTRRDLSFGPPEEAVTRRKQARLRRLLAAWLREHPDVPASEVRLDVVGILLRPGLPARLRHITAVGS